MLIRLCILALTIPFFVTPSVADGAEPEYPRVAAYLIGNHDYADTKFQNDIAKLDLAIFQFLPRFSEWTGSSIEDVLANIKSKNPDFIAWQYVILNEQYLDAMAWPGIGSKLDKERWWLYQSGGSGEIVRGDGAGAELQGEVNYTRFGPRDASGLSYPQWFAQWSNATYFRGRPQWDGIFVDNFWLRPRHDGDYNRDGRLDSASRRDVGVWHREGMASFIKAAKGLMPNLLMTGNIGEWGRESTPATEYANLMDGGLLEGYIGRTWSPEGITAQGQSNGWGSWGEMMERYQRVTSRVKDRSLVLFQHVGLPTDYQAFRYGFASCLLDDAYYIYNNITKPSATVEWFDEYDLAGTASTRWLGKAIDPPQTAAWQNGVYRRRFERGMVLVNPRGNGDRAVTIEPGYSHFNGAQDPNRNNGQPATTVQLRDRDGVVLVKSGSVNVPNLPSAPVAPSLDVN